MRIKNLSAIFESTSIYVITLIIVKSFMSIKFFSQFSDILVPGIFLYIPVLLIIISRHSPEEYGFTLKGWTVDLLYVIGCMAVFFSPVFFVYYIYARIFLSKDFHFNMPDGLVVLVLTQILIVGLSEEAFFRGYLQKRLEEGIEGNFFEMHGIKLSWALFIANVLFTFTHIIVLGQWWRISVFLPGLVFGWLRAQRKSLIAPVLFHGLSNIFMSILEASF